MFLIVLQRYWKVFEKRTLYGKHIIYGRVLIPSELDTFVTKTAEQHMNRYLLIGIIWLLAGMAAASAVALQYFQASPEGTDVRLDWEVDNESSLIRFELHRKLEGEGSYAKIATISPGGTRRYTYIDSELFRTNAMAASVFYKLEVISGNGETAFYASVSHNPNAVQRSWGSIKSMFR